MQLLRSSHSSNIQRPSSAQSVSYSHRRGRYKFHNSFTLVPLAFNGSRLERVDVLGYLFPFQNHRCEFAVTELISQMRQHINAGIIYAVGNCNISLHSIQVFVGEASLLQIGQLENLKHISVLTLHSAPAPLQTRNLDSSRDRQNRCQFGCTTKVCQERIQLAVRNGKYHRGNMNEILRRFTFAYLSPNGMFANELGHIRRFLHNRSHKQQLCNSKVTVLLNDVSNMVIN